MSEKSFIERVKQNWFFGIIFICAAVVGATWQVSYHIRVAPKEDEIKQLKSQVENLKSVIKSMPQNRTEHPIMLKETGVFEGDSATTIDGRCNVKIIEVSQNSVSLSVALDTIQPIEFKDKRPGDRIRVDSRDRYYYIDLYRIRGNIVDLSIFGFTK